MVKGRFAPSPSGRMHLGNIYAALISYLSAKSQGGSWIVRIEDLDTQRCKSEYTRLVLEDLRWLGLFWDEGPEGTDGIPTIRDEKYFQSKRTAFYEEALKTLREKDLVYPCWCKRADLLSSSAPHASDGTVIYSGRCKNLTEAEKKLLAQKSDPALRLRVPDEEDTFTDRLYGLQRANLAHSFGDCIIRRADKNFAYQLAVTCDDAMMGVTEVVRGRDLLSSTHIQRFIALTLGFTSAQTMHIPLLTDESGRRLSKRDKDLDMKVLREVYSPQQLIGKILFWCGQTEKNEAVSLEEAVSIFSAEKLPANDIVVK